MQPVSEKVESTILQSVVPCKENLRWSFFQSQKAVKLGRNPVTSAWPRTHQIKLELDIRLHGFIHYHQHCTDNSLPTAHFAEGSARPLNPSCAEFLLAGVGILVTDPGRDVFYAGGRYQAERSNAPFRVDVDVQVPVEARVVHQIGGAR